MLALIRGGPNVSITCDGQTLFEGFTDDLVRLDCSYLELPTREVERGILCIVLL